MGSRSRMLVRKGWLPSQHGGWAIVLLPVLVGMGVSGFAPVQLALLGAALSTFLAAQVWETWLKSRRKPRYYPALVTYVGLTAIFGLILLISRPFLFTWSWVLLPYIPFLIYEWYCGRSTGVWARALLVVVCVFLSPAAYMIGPMLRSWSEEIIATAVVLCYLLGSIFYVRSMIRGRNNPRWMWVSWTYHGALLVVALLLAISRGFSWWYMVLAAVLATRAVMLPLMQKKGTRVRPGLIGAGEIAMSVLTYCVAIYG